MMVVQLSVKLAGALLPLGQTQAVTGRTCEQKAVQSCAQGSWKLAGLILAVCWTPSFSCLAKAAFSEGVLSLFLAVGSHCWADPFCTSENAKLDVKRSPFISLSLCGQKLAADGSSAASCLAAQGSIPPLSVQSWQHTHHTVPGAAQDRIRVSLGFGYF